jgi:hypothetical protein
MRCNLLIILSATFLIGCGLKSDIQKPVISYHKTVDQNIKAASKRWMANRNIKDFQLLREQLPLGVSVDQVELLLGDSHGFTQDDGHAFYEYIVNDPANNKTANWSVEFDEKDILVKWGYNGRN